MARASAWTRGVTAALLAAAMLTGCGLVGGTDRRDPEWAHDEGSGRYYRPGLVMQSADLVEEHFPMLAEHGPVAAVDGRFTDPDERVPFPAQDDYWWQAAVRLEPDQVEALLAASAAAGASDLGGADEPRTVPAAEVREVLVPTLEAGLEPCEEDWVPVMPALTRTGSSNVSEAGDLLELTVLCEDAGVLVTSARDM
jgi:hypothetical protein